QERVYSRIAIGISQGVYKSARDVIIALRPVYPNDDIFRATFATKTMDTSSSRNKQIVRYILAKLDAQITGAPFVVPPAEMTIEHILPENPDTNWATFSDVEVSSEVYRIGNMALLEAQLNRDAGNRPYSQKASILLNSTISSTKSIPNRYSDWNTDTINKRQAAQASFATAIWRVAQLHE
ncbi:MAG: HNH endonuclease family protein, partial [Paracoccaceae bacterium]